MTRPAPPKWLEIDRYVEAYEEAHVSRGGAELADFLPDAEHPHYVAILCELVRVDLELAWVRGQPRPLEDYLVAFPCLLMEQGDTLQQLAFEHYRQRGEHGEQPTRDEYASRFGVDTSGWPPPPESPTPLPCPVVPAVAGTDGASLCVQSATQESHRLYEASLAYARFRLGPERDDEAALTSLWASLSIPDDVAELFRDLHATQPQAAWRLARGATALPNVGDAFLDFLLVGELGAGSFGRVYLARQLSLADRLVVLKVSAALMGEPRLLAQLQHTNIVPIYSVHHTNPLQAVCMPYFGATTLADVLRELRGLAALPSSGSHFISTIHGRQASTAVAPSRPPEAPTLPAPVPATAEQAFALAPDILNTLKHSSYIDAVLWLGARLAEGLAHAHARGIYHHDLKPANVLLADDGTPMLLDFNLAEDVKAPRSAAAVRVGGTLPYMAPEQLQAFQGARQPVDARSDVYSLGIMLFELLTARYPFSLPGGTLPEVLQGMIAERRQAPPTLRQFNRAVSPAVEAIVRRCLQPDPERRYQSASQLREDVEHQLTHQKLKHTPEPSLRERFAKWRRRNPRLTSVTSVCLLAAVLLGVLGGTIGVLKQRLARHQARTRMLEFLDEKGRVEVLVSIVSDSREPLDDFRAQARRLLDKYGVRAGGPWQEQPAVSDLAEDERRGLVEEVGHLAFFLARAESLQAQRRPDTTERAERLAEAMQLNAVAHASFSPERRPAAIEWQQEELRRLARPTETGDQPPATARFSPRTARDAYLLAFDLCAQEKFAEALPLAQQAVKADPQLFAAHFLLGRCYLYLGQDVRAEQEFGVCVALWPQFHWAYFNRGTIRHRLGLYAAAREDFDRVLELKPNLVEAYLERAQVRQGEKDYAGAVADYTQALQGGAANVYFLRARAHTLAGDREAARQDMAEGMRRDPDSEQGWVARGLARLPQDTAGALADFDAALKLNPRSRPARQNKAYVLSELLNKVPDSVAVLDGLLKDYPEYLPALGGRGVLLARQGKRREAHADAVACLRLSKRPEILYQVAGLYALTSRQAEDDRREAYRLLAAAFAERGYGLDLVARDTDLDPIRDQSEFRRIVSAATFLHAAAKPK